MASPGRLTQLFSADASSSCFLPKNLVFSAPRCTEIPVPPTWEDLAVREIPSGRRPRAQRQLKAPQLHKAKMLRPARRLERGACKTV